LSAKRTLFFLSVLILVASLYFIKADQQNNKSNACANCLIIRQCRNKHAKRYETSAHEHQTSISRNIPYELLALRSSEWDLEEIFLKIVTSEPVSETSVDRVAEKEGLVVS